MVRTIRINHQTWTARQLKAPQESTYTRIINTERKSSSHRDKTDPKSYTFCRYTVLPEEKPILAFYIPAQLKIKNIST